MNIEENKYMYLKSYILISPSAVTLSKVGKPKRNANSICNSYYTLMYITFKSNLWRQTMMSFWNRIKELKYCVGIFFHIASFRKAQGESSIFHVICQSYLVCVCVSVKILLNISWLTSNFFITMNHRRIFFLNFDWIIFLLLS